jgi:hypothetical protein
MSGPLPDTADVSILVTSSLALANVSNLTVAPVWVLNWLAMSCCQAANSDVHVQGLAGAVGAAAASASAAAASAAARRQTGGRRHGGEHCERRPPGCGSHEFSLGFVLRQV